MTTERPICDSFITAADLSTKQWLVVKISAANTIAVATANTDVQIGILQDKPAASGRAARVAVGGRSKAYSGGALGTAGISVSADSAGKLVATAAGTRAVGVLLTTAAGADELVEILVCPHSRPA